MTEPDGRVETAPEVKSSSEVLEPLMEVPSSSSKRMAPLRK